MKIVGDTSFFIHYSNFSLFEEIYTTKEVLKEIKDFITKIKVSGLNIIVKSPKKQFIEKVENVCKKLGENLSETDKKILALSLELSLPIATDDLGIQNVAKYLKIKIFPIRFKLEKKRKIFYICPNCKTSFNKNGFCENCGIKLKKVVIQL